MKGAMNEREDVLKKEGCGQVSLSGGAEGGSRLGSGREDGILGASLGGTGGEGAEAGGRVILGRRWWQESSGLQDQSPRKKSEEEQYLAEEEPYLAEEGPYLGDW